MKWEEKGIFGKKIWPKNIHTRLSPKTRKTATPTIVVLLQYSWWYYNHYRLW